MDDFAVGADEFELGARQLLARVIAVEFLKCNRPEFQVFYLQLDGFGLLFRNREDDRIAQTLVAFRRNQLDEAVVARLQLLLRQQPVLVGRQVGDRPVAVADFLLQLEDGTGQSFPRLFVGLGQDDVADDLLVGDGHGALVVVYGHGLLIGDADDIAFGCVGLFQDVLSVEQVLEGGFAVRVGHIGAQRNLAGLVIKCEGGAGKGCFGFGVDFRDFQAADFAVDAAFDAGKLDPFADGAVGRHMHGLIAGECRIVADVAVVLVEDVGPVLKDKGAVDLFGREGQREAFRSVGVFSESKRVVFACLQKVPFLDLAGTCRRGIKTEGIFLDGLIFAWRILQADVRNGRLGVVDVDAPVDEPRIAAVLNGLFLRILSSVGWRHGRGQFEGRLIALDDGRVRVGLFHQLIVQIGPVGDQVGAGDVAQLDAESRFAVQAGEALDGV